MDPSYINSIKEEPKNTAQYIPWPSILILIIGLILTIYTGIAPNINSDRRIFGVVMIMLWSLLFFFITYVFWDNKKYEKAWLIVLIPLFLLSIFFILIILLNLGAPS